MLIDAVNPNKAAIAQLIQGTYSEGSELAEPKMMAVGVHRRGASPARARIRSSMRKHSISDAKSGPINKGMCRNNENRFDAYYSKVYWAND